MNGKLKIIFKKNMVSIITHFPEKFLSRFQATLLALKRQ